MHGRVTAVMVSLKRLAALAAALAIAGCGQGAATSSATPVPSAAAVPPSSTSHVVVIVMENREYGRVMRGAPFVRRFAGGSASAPSFFAIRHPSLPNYLALTGGSTFGIASDCTSCHVRATNLVDQLEAAHRSWKAYMEGLPHACYKGASAGSYAKKHNPFLYYDDVASNRRRCNRVVPGKQLARDLRAGRLPTFAWITPDLCDDTHDCSLATGDRYLSRLVPAVMRGIGPHGVLFLTWDEGDSDVGCCGVARGGRIATVVAGPDVRPGASIPGDFTHYSTLRTIEDVLGLPPLRAAASAPALDAAFTAPPSIR
jgi:phosphatidylinositol-3-phosphatase